MKERNEVKIITGNGANSYLELRSKTMSVNEWMNKKGMKQTQEIPIIIASSKLLGDPVYAPCFAHYDGMNACDRYF